MINEDHGSRVNSVTWGFLTLFAYCGYVAWAYLHEYSTAKDMAARALGTTIDDPRWAALMSKVGVDNLIMSALPEVILQNHLKCAETLACKVQSPVNRRTSKPPLQFASGTQKRATCCTLILISGSSTGAHRVDCRSSNSTIQ
jgi:hypothetical protein